MGDSVAALDSRDHRVRSFDGGLDVVVFGLFVRILGVVVNLLQRRDFMLWEAMVRARLEQLYGQGLDVLAAAVLCLPLRRLAVAVVREAVAVGVPHY